MRKWYILLMTAVGMTLLMLLGYNEPTMPQARVPDGGALQREPGGEDESAQERVTIQAVVSVDREAFTELAATTARYESMRPNVEVSLANVPQEDLYIRYRGLTETGEAPDVMLYPTMWVRHEAAEGRLLALDDYISVERQSQWFEAVRGAVRWNGYLWGVPVDWDPYVFVIRTDAVASLEPEGPAAWVEAAGYAPETGDPESYGAELLAQLLPSSEDGVHQEQEVEADSVEPANADDGAAAEGASRAMLGPEPAPAAPEEAKTSSGGIEGKQVSVLSDDEEAPGMNGDSGSDPDSGANSESVEAASIAAGPDKRSAPSGVGSVAAVKLGQAPWAFVTLREAVLSFEAGEEGTDLSVAAPFAEGTGSVLPPFHGSSYVVSPSTAHPAEAAEWIRYVTEETAEERSIADGARWPVRRTLYGLSSVSGDGPILSLSSAPKPNDWISPLSAAVRLDPSDAWPAYRSVMRLFDRHFQAYDSPPAELPYWEAP
ncbi:extracellular solute-binding protein [Paenibacillus sp. TRM 82003]|nr:extracellular solute-binding protein [Paenibacillus sp. TRM 82003]